MLHWSKIYGFFFYGSMSIVHIKHMLHFPKNICSAVHLPEPSINQSINLEAGAGGGEDIA